MTVRPIKPEAYEFKKAMSSRKPRKHYPEFHIDLKHLAEAKKWEIGKKYRLTLDVQMSSLNVRNETEGRGEGGAGFDIIGIGVGEAAKPTAKAKAKPRRYPRET